MTAGEAPPAAYPFTHRQELIGLAVAPDNWPLDRRHVPRHRPVRRHGRRRPVVGSPWLTGLPVGDTALAFGPLPPGPTDTAVDTGAPTGPPPTGTSDTSSTSTPSTPSTPTGRSTSHRPGWRRRRLQVQHDRPPQLGLALFGLGIVGLRRRQ
ncbi:MAG: hypothetical protein R3F59_10975 [Myxococcota bacterium]